MATSPFEAMQIRTNELLAALQAGGLPERASVEIAAAFTDLIATTLRHEDEITALKRELAKYKSKRKRK